MKAFTAIAITLTFLAGCKKEEANSAPGGSQAATSPTPAKDDAPKPTPPVAQANNPTPTPPAPQPKADRKDQARAELERMLGEWQAGAMPKEFVDVALLFTHGGVTDKLLDYKVNALIPMEPPSTSFKGTINLTVERKPTKQVRVMMREEDGKWKALISE